MPRNIVIDSTAIISIVAAASFDSGGLNAGTPFDTASTPVIAVQPFENAVSNKNSVNGCAVTCVGAIATTGCTEPVSAWIAPTTISASVVKMKKYVGTAKI